MWLTPFLEAFGVDKTSLTQESSVDTSATIIGLF